MKTKILVIEDNLQNRYLFKLLLQKEGYEVLEAAEGASGIAMALACKPDLILLDIQLPDLDGYQVARSLRKDTKTARTPIVAVTSYAMVGDREKTIAAGCTGYIEKPINPKTFIAEIAPYLAAAPKQGQRP